MKKRTLWNIGIVSTLVVSAGAWTASDFLRTTADVTGPLVHVEMLQAPKSQVRILAPMDILFTAKVEPTINTIDTIDNIRVEAWNRDTPEERVLVASFNCTKRRCVDGDIQRTNEEGITQAHYTLRGMSLPGVSPGNVTLRITVEGTTGRQYFDSVQFTLKQPPYIAPR
ncbi:MAG: hypothetical protein Q7R81_02160 [Candidatus Peregrinibacteria bacterium]|nr:hypothetical protein [Candidatus Peregrinibacteria bacterium]